VREERKRDRQRVCGFVWNSCLSSHQLPNIHIPNTHMHIHTHTHTHTNTHTHTHTASHLESFF